MKRYSLIKPLLYSIIFLFNMGCSNDEPNPKNEDQTDKKAKSYLASGTYGDVLTYEIDSENQSFLFHNETTLQSDSGDFSLSPNNKHTGVYEFNYKNSTYYGIELVGKAFVTSLPSGRDDNKLCFGLSNSNNLSNDYSPAQLAGKYLYVNYNDLDDPESYGGYEIKTDGTFTWQLAPENEVDFDETKHFAGGGVGTWRVSTNDPSRIIFTESGIEYIGTIYPGKAMLIDNGVGGGFSLGIFYPETHVAQAAIAGRYRFLDITLEGNQGVGYYDLNGSGGNLDYYAEYYATDKFIDEGTVNNFAPVETVNNMFKCTALYESEIYTTWFVILPGEIMLHFCAGDNGIISYGIGARIDQ